MTPSAGFATSTAVAPGAWTMASATAVAAPSAGGRWPPGKSITGTGAPSSPTASRGIISTTPSPAWRT